MRGIIIKYLYALFNILQVSLAFTTLKGCTHRAIILLMGPFISIDINHLKPSHSGNTYPLRFLYFLPRSNISNISFAIFANFDVK